MKGKKREISSQIYEYDFAKLAKKVTHARERMRYLAFAHMQEGKTNIEVAKIFKVNRMTVTAWIKKFNQKGLDGLKEKKGRGAKRKLDPSAQKAFRQAVIELQDRQKGGRIKGKDVLKLMREKFGIKCCLTSVYYTLHRADLVWISGRSKHPKSSPEIQEAFKKTSKKPSKSNYLRKSN